MPPLHRFHSVLILAWCVALILASRWLADPYSGPGPSGSPSETWPKASRLTRSSDCSTLVLFVHPHCPCARASLDELHQLAVRGGNRLHALVVFVVPSGAPEGWEQTSLWHRALTLSDLCMHIDREGVEARRFGALTSGQALLYGPEGRSRFRGGIAAESGHSGHNSGRRAILEVLGGSPAERAETAVYGCLLFNREICCAEESGCQGQPR